MNNNTKQDLFYRNLLTNIYKAAHYLGEKADSRSRDFSRDDLLRQKDQGLADAYANIKQMILYHDTIGQVDYFKTNGVIEDIPNILK